MTYLRLLRFKKISNIDWLFAQRNQLNDNQIIEKLKVTTDIHGLRILFLMHGKTTTLCREKSKPRDRNAKSQHILPKLRALNSEYL